MSADIKHLEVKALEGELGLDDAGRLDTSPENVLLGRNVLGGGDPGRKHDEVYSGGYTTLSITLKSATDLNVTI